MKPKTLTIPTTLKAAQKALGGLGKLLTAKDWERAAIVYAFTYEPGMGMGGQNRNPESRELTCPEFAKLGIYGLTGGDAVYRYRRAWAWAVGEGFAEPTMPGVATPLPEIAFPAARNGGRHVREVTVLSGSAQEKIIAITETLADDPVAAKIMEDAFVQRAGRDIELAMRVHDVYSEHHTKPARRKRSEGTTAAGNLGFGAAVYSRIKQEGDDHLEALLAYLVQQHDAGDLEIRLLAGEEDEHLEKGVGLIRGYQERINRAVGVDADATFARLMGKE